jgi:hypothetical protein
MVDPESAQSKGKHLMSLKICASLLMLVVAITTDARAGSGTCCPPGADLISTIGEAQGYNDVYGQWRPYLHSQHFMDTSTPDQIYYCTRSVTYICDITAYIDGDMPLYLSDYDWCYNQSTQRLTILPGWGPSDKINTWQKTSGVIIPRYGAASPGPNEITLLRTFPESDNPVNVTVTDTLSQDYFCDPSGDEISGSASGAVTFYPGPRLGPTEVFNIGECFAVFRDYVFPLHSAGPTSVWECLFQEVVTAGIGEIPCGGAAPPFTLGAVISAMDDTFGWDYPPGWPTRSTLLDWDEDNNKMVDVYNNQSFEWMDTNPNTPTGTPYGWRNLRGPYSCYAQIDFYLIESPGSEPVGFGWVFFTWERNTTEVTIAVRYEHGTPVPGSAFEM